MKATSCSRIWPVWDPGFDPQNPPEKVYVVPFLRFFLFFPVNEAHTLFGWGSKMGGLGGGKRFMLKKFMCFPVP